jgi:hypothetical protein
MELNIFYFFLGGYEMDLDKNAEDVKSSFKTHIVFRNIFKEALVAFLVCLAVYGVTFYLRDGIYLRNGINLDFLNMIFITATVFVIIASVLLIISMGSLIVTCKSINKFSSYTSDFDKNMAELEKALSDRYNVACALAIGYKIMYNELYERAHPHITEKEVEKFEKLKTFGGMAEILSTATTNESLSSQLKTVGDNWAD